MFKRICSLLAVLCLTVTTCFANPIGDLKKQFLKDSFQFQFAPELFTKVANTILHKYNQTATVQAGSVMEIPRDVVVAEYLKFYPRKKMTCATQSAYYSKLFTEKGIRNYVIHILRREGDNVLSPHDNLIYFHEGKWKMADFTGAQNAISQVKEIFPYMTLENYLSDDEGTQKLLEKYFNKDFKEYLKKRSRTPFQWFAVTYYDGNSQYDLGNLSPDIELILKQYGYLECEIV